MPRYQVWPAMLLACWLPAGMSLAGDLSLGSALETISAADLQRHVEVLADDSFEGREAGSRGGRAAGVYVAQQLERLGLRPAGTDGGYYQPFSDSYRNVLGIFEGADPALRNEFVVVGAHYDHVGYGNKQSSFGPLGFIHNGADDNASGVAGLLEVIEALSRLEPPPRRSVLFAFWDAEENGLNGSKHWVAEPTVPLAQVRIGLNVDMIGRLRDDRVEISGARTAGGLRDFASRANEQDLLLDFTWEMRDDSDHYSFFAANVPTLMLHTGLHEDYHRPSDDAERVNAPGTQRVAQLLFGLTHKLADAAELPAFRAQSRRETPAVQKRLERALPAPPGRLGVRWEEAADSSGGLRVTGILPASPARQAGLQAGDVILRFDGHAVTSADELRGLVLAAGPTAQLTVLRAGESEPREVTVALPGSPVRLGISWRTDEAEPGALIVSRVLRGSAAWRAGIAVNDRLLAFAGEPLIDGPDFTARVQAATRPLELTIERQGRVRAVTVLP